MRCRPLHALPGVCCLLELVSRVSVYGCEGVARILKVPFDYALGLRHGLERETWLPRTNDEDYNRGLSVGCSLRDYLGDYS